MFSFVFQISQAMVWNLKCRTKYISDLSRFKSFLPLFSIWSEVVLES